jgi:hypothetical protein
MSADHDYREQALKLFPWICGRCAREFPASRVRELTVHHKDGNHDRNPRDGSNWELLCIYCHENEHARLEDAKAAAKAGGGAAAVDPEPAKHRPFADLAKKLRGS